MVSDVVFAQLRDLGLPNFVVESEVVKPPAATLDMNRNGQPAADHC